MFNPKVFNFSVVFSGPLFTVLLYPLTVVGDFMSLVRSLLLPVSRAIPAALPCSEPVTDVTLRTLALFPASLPS